MSRRALPAAIAGAVAVVLILSSASWARADFGSLQVFLFAPSGTLNVGDSVTVTIRVYSLGLAVDPTNLSVFIIGATGTRNLTYVRQATGAFSSMFQIESSDLAGYYFDGTDWVVVSATASLGGMEYPATAYITVQASPPALQLTLTAPQGWVLPGATISLNATVLLNGVPADPTSLSVDAALASPGGGYLGQVEIPMGHEGTGLYSGTYPVPADTPQDSTLYLTGHAALGADAAFANTATLTVGLPHAFAVWYRVRAVERAYSLVDILVANETGWPVEGANVSLVYTWVQPCGMGFCNAPRWVYATTNRFGAAPFNLTYSDIHSFVEFAIFGNVSVGARNQTYGGVVVRPEDYAAVPYRDLCPSDGFRSYAPGDTIRRTYHGACAMGGPDQTYHYYAVSAHGVIANGSVRSDSGGNFTLSFTAPAEDFNIVFNTYINVYLGWWTFHDFVRVADPALVHISNLSVGRTAQITVDIPGASGTVSFLPYNLSNAVNPIDARWRPEARYTSGRDFPAQPGAPFHADLVIPRFLPKDQDYLLTVLVGDAENYTYSYSYAQVLHLANLPPAASAAFSPLSPVVGEPVTADASASADPDGSVVAYTVDWGDGSSTGWAAGPQAVHRYAEPGTYTVTVQVLDDSGATGASTYSVVVDPAILGLRASTFYVLTVVALAAAVAVAAAVLSLRRRRAKQGGTDQALPPVQGPRPPGSL